MTRWTFQYISIQIQGCRVIPNVIRNMLVWWLSSSGDVLWGFIQVQLIFSGHLGLVTSFPVILEMSHLMTKPTKWHMRPAKTQISLGIHPVWSESWLYTQWVAKEPSFLNVDITSASLLSALRKLGLSAQPRLWSGWADAQADLSLRWAHMPFCWFCHEAAEIKNIRSTKRQNRHRWIKSN